jgi:hypothetical protein
MSYVLLQISLQNIISFFFFLVSKLPYGRGHDDVIYILYMYQGRIQDLWSFVHICHNRVTLLHIKSASIVKTIVHRGHDDVIYVIIELLYYILNLLVSSKLSFIAATMMLYMS